MWLYEFTQILFKDLLFTWIFIILIVKIDTNIKHDIHCPTFFLSFPSFLEVTFDWNMFRPQFENVTKEIKKAAINTVLSNPDENYAWSPCLFQSQVTSRKPGKLRKNVGQWISCLIFVSILTINIMNIHVKSKSLNKIWVNSYSHNIHMQLALGKSWRISFTNSKYSEFEHFKNCVNLWNFLFRALNYSKLEEFRALKSPILEDFNALKSSNLAIGF